MVAESDWGPYIVSYVLYGILYIVHIICKISQNRSNLHQNTHHWNLFRHTSKHSLDLWYVQKRRVQVNIYKQDNQQTQSMRFTTTSSSTRTSSLDRKHPWTKTLGCFITKEIETFNKITFSMNYMICNMRV